METMPHLDLHSGHLKPEFVDTPLHSLYKEHFREQIQECIRVVNAAGGYVKFNRGDAYHGYHRILARKDPSQ